MINGSPIYLSIVIPAYNEEVNLASTLKEIASFLKSKDYASEVIIVDDRSEDKTADIARSLSGLFHSFTLLENDRNHGKGYSVKRGVLASRGDRILFMDADNATRISEVDRLMAAMKDGVDVVIGSRRIQGAKITRTQPFYRVILGNIYIILSNVILGIRVADYNCGFKLYSKEAAKRLFSRLTRDDWSFDSELIFLISKYGFRLKAVPVTWENKKTSKVRPLRACVESFLGLCRIRLLDMKGVYR